MECQNRTWRADSGGERLPHPRFEKRCAAQSILQLRIPASWVLCCCLATVPLLSCLGVNPGQPRRGETAGKVPNLLRILSYNIRHGEGMDGAVDLTRSARLILALTPDLVALQELDRGVKRSGRVDQAAELGKLTGMHSVFGKFLDYEGGEYGMALLSKYPIERFVNHPLPPGAEPRTALTAEIRLPYLDISVLLTGIHLYSTTGQRLSQARQLVKIFEKETVPIILAGDFNSTPESPVMSLFAESWEIPVKQGDRLTFPSDDPRTEIDFILFRPRARFAVVDCRVVEEPVASDHRPVLLDLRILP